MGLRNAVVRADCLFVHIYVPGHNADVHRVVSFCNCRHTVMPQHADTVYYVSICHDASVPTSPVNALSVDLPASQGGRLPFCIQQREILLSFLSRRYETMSAEPQARLDNEQPSYFSRQTS